ncbi:MAG TPA: hypothetical protein VFV19_19860 [Candidatus Polarisedimenticolaceae bacterium]|nr:hypothetical protein [Candidatus Polarisedimenticolaceae bacterium]
MRVWGSVAIVVALTAAPAYARHDVPRDLDVINPIFDESLRATGLLDTHQRADAIDRFDDLARRLASSVGTSGSLERRAKRLHERLHSDTFKLYRIEADSPLTVLTTGEYNCVSASLVEGLLGRALGLDTWFVAGPQHVFLRVELPEGRSVDIETTAPDGFDARKNAGRAGRLLLAYKLATPEEISARGSRAIVDLYRGVGEPIPLEHAPAFVWHNSGKRALEHGDAVSAAVFFREAAALHPAVSMGLEGTETALAQAFRIAYDGGRFEEAYDIAAMGIAIVPDHVSGRDRLIAAGVQRIEAAADAGDPELADAVLQDVRRLTGDRAERFERGAIPVIIACALRVGDWPTAGRLADRYATVEPDPVESARLQRWVALRSGSKP